MKICESCTFNLENYLMDFQTGQRKMLNRYCNNKNILEQHCIYLNCLQLFAKHLIENCFDLNGYEFYELPPVSKQTII